jgi:ubiquinone/menaquinone biosynthesis C-methylase UbiE
MSRRKSSQLLKQELEEYYDHSAIEYQQAHYSKTARYAPLQFRQRYIEEMIKDLLLAADARVLDVGCGPGELTLSLLQSGYDVSAVDISQSMVDLAVRSINSNGFPQWDQIATGDIEGLEFDDQYFDIVVASGVLEYQREDEKSLSEIHRVLKEGGYLILNVTNRFCPNRVMGLPYLWSKQWAPTRAILDFMKSRVLRKGSTNPLPFFRAHSPGAFDRTLSKAGFDKLNHNYFHFSPLPPPFSALFGVITSPISNLMEKLSRSPLGFLGGGYIVIAKTRR